MKKALSLILVLALTASLAVPFCLLIFDFCKSANPFEEFDVMWDSMTSSVISDNSEKIKSTDVCCNYIVKFSDSCSLSDIHKCLTAYGYKQLSHSNERMFAVNIDDEAAFKNEYEEFIDLIAENGTLELCGTANDPLASKQWELDALDIYDAWDVKLYDRKVIVAVLDSGIYRQHEDFAGVDILPGFDTTNDTVGVTTDVNGHGTKVASIIAAATNNGVGMAGLCDSLSILPIRVCDSTGYVYSSDFIEALYFAADSGAGVINMSFGGYVYSAAEEVAVEYATSKGCILVSATGNEGLDFEKAGKKSYPASYNNVISVGAADDSGSACDFSQYNDAVDLLAPGYDITVADLDGGYKKESGTSFAAPYVSAIIGLSLMAVDDGVKFTADQFVTLVADLNGNNRNDHDGYGMINANAVLLSINRPLYSGVADNGVYHKNITITYNRGSAALDGEVFASGEIVKFSGNHSLEITDAETKIAINFITDNIPLKYEYIESDNSASITFTRGNGFLDGVPYISGTAILNEGFHYFTLIGPYGNSETYEFECRFSAPEIYGVANGGYYTEPVRISASKEGVLTLNGSLISSDTVIATNGQYVLTSEYNNKKRTLYFTVAIPNVSSYDITVTDARIALDNDYNTFYLYNSVLSGVRVYSKNNLSLASGFVRTKDGIIAHAFFGNNIAFIHSGGVTVFDRGSLASNTNASSTYMPFNSIATTAVGGQNAVYYSVSLGNTSKIYRMNLNDGTSTQIDTVSGTVTACSFYANKLVVLSSENVVYGYTGEGEKLFAYSVQENSKSVLCGESCFTNGLYVYNNSDGNRLFSLVATETPVAFIDSYLITNKHIYDLKSCVLIGEFGNEIADIAFDNENNVYKCFANLTLELIKGSESAEDFLSSTNAADANLISSGNIYTDSAFGDILSLPTYTDISSSVLSVNEKNIYSISVAEQRLYIFNTADLSVQSILPLRFRPSSICCTESKLYITFEDANYILCIDTVSLQQEYLYTTHSYVLSKISGSTLFVLDKNGDMFAYQTKNISKGATTVIRLQNAISFDCTERYIYALLRPASMSFVYKISVSDYSIVDTLPVKNDTKQLIATDNYLFVDSTVYYADSFSLAYALSETVIYADNNYALTDKALYWALDGSLLGSHRYKLTVPIFDSKYNCFDLSANIVNKISNSRSNLHELPATSLNDGDIFKGAVAPSVAFGTVYLDGVLYTPNTPIENGGKHTLLIAMPFGVYKTVSFTIDAQINNIYLNFEKSTISVNETVGATITAKPTTYGTVDVTYKADCDNAVVYDDGTVIGVSAGDCTITATTTDGLHSASFTLHIISSQIIFDSSYFNVRDDGFVDTIPPGTNIETLYSAVSSTHGNVSVISAEGSTVDVGVIQTGMFAVLHDINGNIIDKRGLSVLGDVDCDGYITANDYYSLKNLIADIDSVDSCIKISADTDRNGEVNTFDLLALKEHLLGENSFIDTEAFPVRAPRAVPQLVLPKEVAPGTTFSIALTIENSQNIRALSANIEFDPTYLSISNVTLIGDGYYYLTDKCVTFFTECDLNIIDETVIIISFSVAEHCDEDKLFIKGSELIVYDSSAAKCDDISVDVALNDSPAPDILIFNLPHFQFDSATHEYSLAMSPMTKKVYVYSYPETAFTFSGNTTITNGVADFFATASDASVSERYAFICTSDITEASEPNTPESFKSDNAYLSEVNIIGGTLSPQFDKLVNEYYVITNSVDKVSVIPIPEDDAASVSVSSYDAVSATISVTCTAENGNAKTYIFHIAKDAPYDVDSLHNGNAFKVIVTIFGILTLCFVLALTFNHFRMIFNNKKRT